MFYRMYKEFQTLLSVSSIKTHSWPWCCAFQQQLRAWTDTWRKMILQWLAFMMSTIANDKLCGIKHYLNDILSQFYNILFSSCHAVLIK